MMKELKEKLKWLDPFTYIDIYAMPIVNPNKSRAIETIVYIASAFLFAFVLYNYVLAFLLGTSAPLVIVYSGSMEPVLYRGDVAILTGANSPELKEATVDFPVWGRRFLDFAQPVFSADSKGRKKASGARISGAEHSFDPKGPIVVYFSKIRQQDIIHRAVLKIRAPDGEFLVTFGDNNPTFDQDCPQGSLQCISPTLIPVKELRGKYLFHVPLAGHLKLIVFDDLPRFARCAIAGQNPSSGELPYECLEKN